MPTTITYITTSVSDVTESGASNPATVQVAPQNADYVGVTTADLISRVLSGLGLSWQTDLGDLREGDFSPAERPRETTFAYILRQLNTGANWICRWGGYFLVRNGTQNLAAGGRTIRYQSLATQDGSVLWHGQAATWTPTGGVLTQLRYIGKEQANLRFGTVSGGKPTLYWTHIDESGVRLIDTPTVNGTVGVSGYATPPSLATMTDFPGWLVPDLSHLIVLYAKREMCKKVPDLGGRFAALDAEWQELIRYQRAQSMGENEAFCRFAYGPGWFQ